MSTTTDWSVSTDIYQIVSQIDSLKAKYINDENETTLAVGLFGFLGDTEAKKIQTAIIGTGELGNEMFPQRAKLDKNIVAHAIYCNIGNINATPAHININIAIKETDLDSYMVDNVFTFDRTCPIAIGDYEFHTDYDIVLKRSKRNGSWVYNAYYDMTNVNNISDITNPYLLQPYTINFNNYRYVFIQALARQVTIETTEDKMATSSVIDNKSFSFTFANQLANFDVYITENNVTTRLKPLFYGSAVEAGVTNYCWYLYMADDTIRIGFDQSSYLPGLNASVKVVAQTTLGASGNFNYKTAINDNGFYVDFESSYYNYKKITCYTSCLTNSTDGTDRKTTDELKSLIPKMAMSRGYITTETDLEGYFNLISNDQNRLKMQKKVDNQLERIWYCYLLAKDSLGNVIPTNTLPLQVSLTASYVVEADDGRYVIPCGTTFMYDPKVGYATYIDPSSIPTKYSADYYGSKYYYRTIHNMVINLNPLYCAYYNTIVNMNDYFEYNYLNPNTEIGFITNTNHFERSLLTNNKQYRFTFNMMQSVDEDYGLYTEGSINGQSVITNNMKVFLVIYKDGAPYRYKEASLTAFDSTTYTSSWQTTLITDDAFDTNNKLKLKELKEAGTTNTSYGYFDDNSEAYVYILAKFSSEYGRDKITSIVPDSELTGYSLVNIYKLSDGLTLFRNFTEVMNTRIRASVSEDKTTTVYNVQGIPLVGEHFFTSESNVTYLMDTVAAKKAYIDNCLKILENNMEIDFKLYNTYGYSNTYVTDEAQTVPLGNIDTTWSFKLKLASSSDLTTKNSLISYIKSYVEDLNETGDLHVPNLLHDIKEKFGDLITYVEFLNFNSNALGVNHIILKDTVDPQTVPEFICIRNNLDTDGTTLVPAISVELVS